VGFLDLTIPEHAYLFGFLQGDGTLRRGTGRKGQLVVEISARDIDLLEEFQRIVPFSSSIRMRTRRTNFAEEHASAIWTLCALEARENLQELGLPIGRKSSSVRPPAVPFSERDYLRGLIDADGSVSFMEDGTVAFVSLTTASEAIKDFFIASCPEAIGRPRKSRRNRRDGTFNVMAVNEAAADLSIRLYSDGCLALRRKAEAAGRVHRWKRPVGVKVMSPRRWTSREDTVVLGNTIAEAAQILGRTTHSVSLRRWRLRTEQRITRRALALREPRLFYDPL
jgi:hypothetical protein